MYIVYNFSISTKETMKDLNLKFEEQSDVS